MTCFLGIDAGTSGVKAIVIDEAGKTLGLGYKEVNLIAPGPCGSSKTRMNGGAPAITLSARR